MKTRKGTTLIELLMILFYVGLLIIILIPVFNSYHAKDHGFTSITAKVPSDFKYVIDVQRDFFEYHLSYVTTEGEVKCSRYWSIMFWARDIVWMKQESE